MMTRVDAHGDGDHVEAAGHLAEAPPLEVVLGQADETPPLPPLDRRRRGVPPARLAALHLDEHPGAAVTADQVELAEREPHVALDDDEARAHEKGGGRLFRSAPEGLALVCPTREYHRRKRQGMSRAADTAEVPLEVWAHVYIH